MTHTEQSQGVRVPQNGVSSSVITYHQKSSRLELITVELVRLNAEEGLVLRGGSNGLDDGHEPVRRVVRAEDRHLHL